MLRRATNLKGFHLGAFDGEIGHVKDFYFDDTNWHVRYLIADTGKWLPHRKVLIAPQALGKIHTDEHRIDVQLTREQVEKSPSIDADRPVSRQMEEEYLRYFGWPFYWADPLMWGGPAFVGAVPPPVDESASHEGDPHLRSMHEVVGYEIRARDGVVGRVEDFLIDEDDWSIHELLVDARHSRHGKHGLLSPLFIKNVDWADSVVHVRLGLDDLQNELAEYHPEEEHAISGREIINAYAAGRTFPLP